MIRCSLSAWRIPSKSSVSNTGLLSLTITASGTINVWFSGRMIFRKPGTNGIRRVKNPSKLTWQSLNLPSGRGNLCHCNDLALAISENVKWWFLRLRTEEISIRLKLTFHQWLHIFPISQFIQSSRLLLGALY